MSQSYAMRSERRQQKMPDIVSEIEHIRAKNNKLWMDILRIALIAEPFMTKRVLAEINQNDRTISDYLGKLAHDQT